jgi:hypothetical protein
MPAADLEAGFPNLSRTSYSLESPPTRRYNCIAWAAGDATRWWWPIDHPMYSWPVEPRIESLEGFIQAFSALGYEICDSSAPEVGYEKVAIYATTDPTPTHMARQLADGRWTSKCGVMEDIIHPLEALEGQTYGHVVQLLRRPIDRV